MKKEKTKELYKDNVNKTEKKVKVKPRKGLHGKDTVVARSQKFRLEHQKKEKKSFKEYLKKVYKPVIFSILIILIIILALNVIKWIKFRKYKVYESKMDLYQFTSLYNNSKCKSSQKVTKAEAIKMAIATIFNTDDISGFAKEYNDYPNQTFVEYAKYFNIIGENDITADNYDDTATYLEAVMYFENAKTTFTEIEVKSTDKTNILKNSQAYDVSEQMAFGDMVENNIIVLKTKNINAKKEKLTKGKLNELVVNFLERYALISVDHSRLRFTDLPSNVSEYPYILFDVPNEVYEYKRTEGMPILDAMDSRQLYMYKKDKYLQVKSYVEAYYEAMLNVDFETINFITYVDDMNKYLVYTCQDTTTYDYVEYVKNNHIKLQADVTFLEPCLYFDGSSYRARIKIELKILSADTRDNLILYDNFYKDTYTYNKDSYTIYAEASLTNVLTNNLLYLEYQKVLGMNTLNSDSLDITYTKNVSNIEEVSE